MSRFDPYRDYPPMGDTAFTLCTQLTRLACEVREPRMSSNLKHANAEEREQIAQLLHDAAERIDKLPIPGRYR